MSNAQESNPERLVRYPLTWPAWMAERVAAEARAHTMPMAVWLREAIRKELEQAAKETGQSAVNRAGRLTQDDEPRHHVTDKGGQP